MEQAAVVQLPPERLGSKEQPGAEQGPRVAPCSHAAGMMVVEGWVAIELDQRCSCLRLEQAWMVALEEGKGY